MIRALITLASLPPAAAAAWCLLRGLSSACPARWLVCAALAAVVSSFTLSLRRP